MKQIIALVLASLVLAGCYENGGQKIAREKMQQDIKDLQRGR